MSVNLGLASVGACWYSLRMDWQTLFTAFAGAFGGTAVALAVIGVFGKTLLEHWFKKDFKRYEAKLDALATRDETRFNYRFTSGADATKEIYKRANEVLGYGLSVLAYKITPSEHRNKDFTEYFTQALKLFLNEYGELARYKNVIKYLLPVEVNESIALYQASLDDIMATSEYVTHKQKVDLSENGVSALKGLEVAFRNFAEGKEKSQHE